MKRLASMLSVLLFCAFCGSAQAAQQLGAGRPEQVRRPPPVVVCPRMMTPALAMTLKNERGQVLNGSFYLDPVTLGQAVIGRETSGQYRRGFGSWSVTVQRHWYKPVILRGIRVQEDECGPVRPRPITVRLRPIRGAPLIREFSINGGSAQGFFVGYWPYFQRYSTFLDAPGSVSRQVIWSSSDPAVATIDQTGMLRTVCNRTPGWTVIRATLKADSRITASTRLGRSGGGMVCKRGAVDR